MKTIIVQWRDVTNNLETTEEMRVVISDHSRFVPGSRFDFGFFQIATGHGYTIISLPKSK